ncbi:lipid binding protein isoform X1 [Zea mays]|uniref:lipid binding protein isoform X1 n=1 Tax=Zea mays TaxID=4577 RepID=UPI0004DE8920|nr:lipid binding protein isoform X1 [Zea mays]|eukprot:XP_008668193.1 lipid binding protein isoform X2 [Zea mays]
MDPAVVWPQPPATGRYGRRIRSCLHLLIFTSTHPTRRPALVRPFLAGAVSSADRSVGRGSRFFLQLMADRSDGPIGRLPEHLIIEILIRLPVYEWVQLACVNKHWASIFQGECVWQTAIARNWPSAGLRKRWPGPIPRGSARRRFQALYVSENLVPSGGEIDELVGHTYLYLKEQLERPVMPPSSILHGTIIDQFIACGNTGEKAHDLASKIWLAVIDSLEENQQTFLLLKRVAQEGEII